MELEKLLKNMFETNDEVVVMIISEGEKDLFTSITDTESFGSNNIAKSLNQVFETNLEAEMFEEMIEYFNDNDEVVFNINEVIEVSIGTMTKESWENK